MTLASIDQVTAAATRPEQARALPMPPLLMPALADDAGWRTPDVLREASRHA